MRDSNLSGWSDVEWNIDNTNEDGEIVAGNRLYLKPKEPTRTLEIAKGWEDKGINLPKRATKNAAGYDFEAAEDVEIPSMLEDFTDRMLKRSPERLNHIGSESHLSPEFFYLDGQAGDAIKPVLVPTGIKAKMGSNEFIGLYNRSSNPKRGLYLANGVGVGDADYYNNPSNDGHLMFAFVNLSPNTLHIKKGDRIGQGIFQYFLTVDNEEQVLIDRSGGYGSTGK